MNFQAIQLIPVLPEIFMAVMAMLLLIMGVMRGNESTHSVSVAAMVSMAVSAFLVWSLNWQPVTVLNGLFIMDGFAGLMKLLILLGLVASIALSMKYIRQEQMDRFEYPVLIMLAGLGMMMMVSANNMLSLYIGLELQSLSLYVLAAIHRNHIKSAEAGIKYFILGALASGMLLFGMSLVYGYTGALGFDQIASAIDSAEQPQAGLIVGMVFILAALAFKVSAAPFHMWTPDVYEGAPTSVTALFAIVPKVAAIGLIIRVLFDPFGGIIAEWQQIIWALSLASMTLGAFAGLVQKNIKRLLAYSSIGNMGYAMIGIVAASETGVAAVIVYMAIYMIMTAGTFGIVLTMRRGEMGVETMEDLSGLSRNNPLSAYALGFLMFSMSGIPPLAGFFGKFFVFQAAVAEGFYILAVLGVLTSVVAAYYYLKIIKIMFFDDPADRFDESRGFARKAVVFCSIVFVLFFVLMPSPLINAANAASAVLFTG